VQIGHHGAQNQSTTSWPSSEPKLICPPLTVSAISAICVGAAPLPPQLAANMLKAAIRANNLRRDTGCRIRHSVVDLLLGHAALRPDATAELGAASKPAFENLYDR